MDEQMMSSTARMVTAAATQSSSVRAADVGGSDVTSRVAMPTSLDTVKESMAAEEGATGNDSNEPTQGHGGQGHGCYSDVDLDPCADHSVSLRSTTFGRSTVVEHSHKLEKKQSSGDLHSRLKTRKLLGVGETPDGDVHRSKNCITIQQQSQPQQHLKLSQILGHNDQLYTKLPRGLRVWQYANVIIVSLLAALAILLPSYVAGSLLLTDLTTTGDVMMQPQQQMEDAGACVVMTTTTTTTYGLVDGDGDAAPDDTSSDPLGQRRTCDDGLPRGATSGSPDDGRLLAATRLQGAALAGLAILLWNSLRQTDRELIRCVALASTVFWSLHVLVVSLSLLQAGQFLAGSVFLLPHRLLAAGASLYYCRALCRRPPRPKNSGGQTSINSGIADRGNCCVGSASSVLINNISSSSSSSTASPGADKKVD